MSSTVLGEACQENVTCDFCAHRPWEVSKNMMLSARAFQTYKCSYRRSLDFYNSLHHMVYIVLYALCCTRAVTDEACGIHVTVVYCVLRRLSDLMIANAEAVCNNLSILTRVHFVRGRCPVSGTAHRSLFSVSCAVSGESFIANVLHSYARSLLLCLDNSCRRMNFVLHSLRRSRARLCRSPFPSENDNFILSPEMGTLCACHV